MLNAPMVPALETVEPNTIICFQSLLSIQTCATTSGGALPKTFTKGLPLPAERAVTRPSVVDVGGRVVPPGASTDFDAGSIDAEMAALVDTAVDAAAETKTAAAAAAAGEKAAAAVKPPPSRRGGY